MFVDQTVWTTTLTGLTSTDFSKVTSAATLDTSLHPDLSSSGAQIKFGTYLFVVVGPPDRRDLRIISTTEWTT